MKKAPKNRWLRILGIIVGVFSIFYLLYWACFDYVPLNWATYTNTTSRHHYSFSYPKDWVITECGQGDVLVAKKKVKQCSMPLDVSADYLENVYFQIFIPGNKYSQLSFETASSSALLKGWSTTFLSWDEESAIINTIPGLHINEYIKMRGSAIPVKFDQKYDFVDDVGNHQPNYLSSFTLGFYYHPEVKEEFNWIRNSLEYNYK